MKYKISLLLLVLLFFTSIRSEEFQINNRTSLSQANVDIASIPNGGFVVSWSSYFNSSGRSNDIFCRFYEPNCSPVGNEILINQTPTGNQTEPSIAAKSSNEFIVAWQGYVSEDDSFDIFAQRIDSNGLPLGDELQINNITNGNDQVCPKVAINDSDSLVIVWESEIDSNSTAICGRIYDKNANPIEDEFQISTEPDCRYPNVAMDPNGNFTVVWIQGTRPNFSIMARNYNAQGIPFSEAYKVNTYNITSFTQPAIARDSTGCFLITWDGDPNLASMDDIHARIYEPNGSPLSDQFIVNTTLEKAQQNPQAAINESGQFIIVWDSEGDPNVNEKDIYGQRFDNKGERIGEEFRLNTYIDSDQKCPAVAFINDSQFVTVWQSQEQDGSNYGIFGKSLEMISTADFNIDGYTDFFDYNTFATEWHSVEKPFVSDLNEDEKIDQLDLLAFCENWLINFKE